MRRLLPAIALLLIAIVLLGCGGDGHAQPTETPSSAMRALSNPGPPPTQVLFFRPPGAGAAVNGACFAPSIPVTRPGAWRCDVGDRIIDPCFGATNSQTVVCVEDPTRPDQVVTISLARPLPETALVPDQQPRAWAMITSDGAVCTLHQGARGYVNGLPMTYGCSDGADILGDPVPGDIWMVTRVNL